MDTQLNTIHSIIKEIEVIKQETFQSIQNIKQLNEYNSIQNAHASKEKNEEEESLFKFKEQKILLNIGGEIFQTSRKTLQSHPDSLFNRILTSKEFKEQNSIEDQIELFIDRSAKYFKYILYFLQTYTIDNDFICTLKPYEIIQFIKEAKYYSLNALVQSLSQFSSPNVKYASFEVIKRYNNVVFLNDLDDLNNFNDRSCSRSMQIEKGNSLILELERVVEFNQIEIGLDYQDSQFRWNISYAGANSDLYTSLDKQTWIYIGLIPIECSRYITLINVIKSKAKYIQFMNVNGDIKLSYCRIVL